MKTATILSADIQAANENVKYDAAVKRLLADKTILAWILESCVPEFKGMGIDEIANCIERSPQISKVAVMPDEAVRTPKIHGTSVEDATMTEGSVMFDIRFDASIPDNGEGINLIINVEAQNNFYPGYPIIKRGIYYCSRMISSQYGSVFTKSHYEKIRKVCSIWVCVNPPKGRENTITRYSITEENCIGNVKEPPERYDLLMAVMICLGNPEDGGCTGLLKLLGVLLSSDIKADDKQKILEQDFGIPMTEKLERKVFEMCNLSEFVMEKGMQKGMEKGMEKGIAVSIQRLMEKLGLTSDQAMDMLCIPESDQPKYKSMINQL